MKKFAIVVSLMFSMQYAPAQSLLDIYKEGAIKLVPDAEYAQGNQWDQIFETYYDTIHYRSMGNRKSIVLMPDGSVVVNHIYQNYYYLFDANGKFVKEFGITGRSGMQFKDNNPIEGVINNNFFTAPDNLGKMVCFDFNGNYVKTLTLDYMTRGMIPLTNNKIVVVGWAVWKDKFRDFVAIVDYQTNEQKIIWEHFTSKCSGGDHCKLFNYSYIFEKGGMVSLNTMPYIDATGLNSPPKIAFANDRLIVALPHTGEILAYDINGNLKSKYKIEWAKNSISVEEQKEIQTKAIEKYKSLKTPALASWVAVEENIKAHKAILKQMEEDLGKITAPVPVPVFSNMMKDADDNLLFFEIPKEEGGNKFNVWVYQNGGEFICQSSFECDDYNLSITPLKMIFHKGYIYALQTLKKTKGNPLRLVRFKITN